MRLVDEKQRDDARAKGRRALDAANVAFSKLPEEELDLLARNAVNEARQVLRATAVITLSRTEVTRSNTIERNVSVPSLTATLSSTPS